MRFSAASDPGLVRTRNEDSYLIRPAWDGVFLAVADGLGGHEAGEVASRLATRVLGRLLAARRDPPDEAFLVMAFRKANAAIRRARARRDSPGGDMATTLSAAYVAPGLVVVAHVGDSRVYRHHDGVLTRLTEDQSFVAELVREGALRPEEALHHPHRHMLLHALGSEPTPPVRLTRSEFRQGDVLLACTDGLTEALGEDEIAACLRDVGPDIALRLVAAANARGGEDNTTVLVVWSEEEDALP